MPVHHLVRNPAEVIQCQMNQDHGTSTRLHTVGAPIRTERRALPGDATAGFSLNKDEGERV